MNVHVWRGLGCSRGKDMVAVTRHAGGGQPARLSVFATGPAWLCHSCASGESQHSVYGAPVLLCCVVASVMRDGPIGGASAPWNNAGMYSWGLLISRGASVQKRHI